MKKILSVMIILPMLFFVTACGSETVEKTEPAPASGQSGQEAPKAPDFTLQNYDGEDVTLSDFEGKEVVLNFFATWCPPCREEIPDFINVQDEYTEDVVFLFIDVQEDRETYAAAAEKYSWEGMEVLFDETGELSYNYGVRSFPTTFVLDEEGYLSAYLPGLQTEESIRGALAGEKDSGN